MARRAHEVVRATMGEIGRKLGAQAIARADVPEPPVGAEREYGGEPPYKNGGYFIEQGNERWRFDRRGLMRYIVYDANDKIVALWTRDGGD